MNNQSTDLEISIKELTFVAFDFETTGLNPHTDEIIEIGAVKFKNGQKIGEFQELIKPNVSIPEKITEITGITNNMVKNAPSIDKVLPQFTHFIENCILIAHNSNFDMGFLRKALNEAGYPAAQNIVINSLQLAQKAYPKEASYKLQHLVKVLNISSNKAHRALDDSIQCMKIFISAINQISFMGEITLREILS